MNKKIDAIIDLIIDAMIAIPYYFILGLFYLCFIKLFIIKWFVVAAAKEIKELD